MRLTTEQLTFLARFAKTPDGQFLVGMLEARQAELNTTLRDVTGEEVYRTQGRALEVDNLLDQVKSAHVKLNRGAPSRTPLGNRPFTN